MSHPSSGRSFRAWEPKHRRNGKIRAREVRVLDENKEQLGVMPLSDALRLAQSKNLDLVEIAPTATPPVCRIVNYGKLMYEEAKNQKESRNTGVKLKEVQLSASIDPHDLAIKLGHTIEFLCDDMKVRIRMRFRGRQRMHKDLGIALLNRFVQDAARYGQPDSPPKMLGDRDLNVMLSPLPRNKRARDPRLEPNAPASPAPTAPSTPLSSPPPPAPEPPSAP